MKTIIMEQTFTLLAEENKKEVLEKGIVKEIENKVKYLIINE